MTALIVAAKNTVRSKGNNRKLHVIRWKIIMNGVDLLNIKVKHKAFGQGVITEVSGNYLTIKFAAKESKFLYPDSFEKFIVADDASVQASIMDEIKTVKKAEEERHQAELAARKVEEERKIAAEVVKGAAVSHKTGYIPKPVARSQRIEGKRMTFFVFQGNTFDKEFSGGYIWAPISNKAGTMPHHWTRLLDVRKGDIILHGYDGYVKAISTAKAPCYECVQPNELTVEGLWERDGRRVDCDYIEIRNPVKTSMFKDDIIRLCQVKYSPFDKDGNGNMGYLFEINRELAKIFVEASVINNSYLSEINYISDFLAEE